MNLKTKVHRFMLLALLTLSIWFRCRIFFFDAEENKILLWMMMI